MSTPSLLDFQYNIQKRKYLRKPSRLFSSRDRQDSDLLPIFHLSTDELKRVFDKFDSNKDGKISQEEYKAVLRALMKEGIRAEVEKIFKVADLDGDGFIDFKEFVEVHKKGGGVKTMDIQSAFRAYDLDGDGKINAEELMEMLRRLGEGCSLEECRRMVMGVDTDGDGAVNLDEFTTMMTRSMKPPSSC